AYVVPFIFAFHPAPIGHGTLGEILITTLTASIGVVLLGIGCAGYLFRPLSWSKRAWAWAAAALLMMPPLPWLPTSAADVAGLAITFLATSDVYPIGGNLSTVGRTEEIIGRWLEGRRENFIVATKCFGAMSARPWDQGLSRKHILDAIEGSLRRLGTDYVDLYQLHHPDPSTPMDESLRALDDIVRAGKARYVGCSNYFA